MRVLSSILISVSLLLPCVIIRAAIIHVPDDQPTIQAGIDNATVQDTVLVQPGTYEENIIIEGMNITLGSLFLTTGDTSYISQTIIDGGNNYEASTLLISNVTSTNTIIKGFVITGGWNAGGGIRIYNGNPRLENLIVEGNQGLIDGGGLFSYYSSPIIEDVIFQNNSAVSWGGGAYIGSPMLNEHRAVLRNVTFRDNSAENGGGIYTIHDSLMLQNVIFKDNSAINGGAIYAHGNQKEYVKRCTFNGNSATCGGAVYNSSYMVFSNCVLYGNSADYGGGIYHKGMAGSYNDFLLINSICWNDTPQEIYLPLYNNPYMVIAYSDIQNGEEGIECYNNGDVDWLEGNIDLHPLFQDPDYDDFQLAPQSPCIDAGTSLFVWYNDTFVNMSPDDYYYGAPDMGAYESMGQPPDPFGLIAPTDGSVIESNPVYLEWEPTTDPDGDSFLYRIYISEEPEQVEDNLISATFATYRFFIGEYGTQYWWTVSAWDIPGHETWANQVYSFTIGVDGAEETHESLIPANYEIASVYPNPFNPSTSITVGLPEASELELRINNILGEVVGVIADGRFHQGYHSFTFDGSGLASGIYFMQAAVPGKYNEIRKVVLMK